MIHVPTIVLVYTQCNTKYNNNKVTANTQKTIRYETAGYL